MTATEREIIMRAASQHQYAPGAIAVVIAGFNALSLMQQARAISIYIGLVNEPTLVVRNGAKRGERPKVAPKKKPVYRHNSETVKTAAVARRKLEAMRDDKI